MGSQKPGETSSEAENLIGVGPLLGPVSLLSGALDHGELAVGVRSLSSGVIAISPSPARSCSVPRTSV
jgi:hypothetical protein